MKYVLLLALAVSGCATMNDIDCSDRTIETKPFEDKNIKALYVVDFDRSVATFVFENKTEKSIKIIWDESAYIDQNGINKPLFTGDMKIADRGGSVVPTFMQPKGKASVAVLPKSHVDWGHSGWEYSMICGRQVHVFGKKDTTGCFDKDYSYAVTYEVEGKKTTLKPTFRAKEAVKKECIPAATTP